MPSHGVHTKINCVFSLKWTQKHCHQSNGISGGRKPSAMPSFGRSLSRFSLIWPMVLFTLVQPMAETHSQRSRCDLRQRINHLLMVFKLFLLLTLFGRHTIGSSFFSWIFFSRFKDFSLRWNDTYDILLPNSDVTVMGSWPEKYRTCDCLHTHCVWLNGDHFSISKWWPSPSHAVPSYWQQFPIPFFAIHSAVSLPRQKWISQSTSAQNQLAYDSTQCLYSHANEKNNEIQCKTFKLEIVHRLVWKCRVRCRTSLSLSPWWLCEWVFVKLFLWTSIEWVCTLLNRSHQVLRVDPFLW